MAKFTLMDELHVSIYAVRGLRQEEYDTIRRSLMKKRFRIRLQRAARAVVHKYPSLRTLRVKVSR